MYWSLWDIISMNNKIKPIVLALGSTVILGAIILANPSDKITFDYCGEIRELGKAEFNQLRADIFVKVDIGEPLDPCLVPLYMRFLNDYGPVSVDDVKGENVLLRVNEKARNL